MRPMRTEQGRLCITNQELHDLQCLIATYRGVSGYDLCCPCFTARCQPSLVFNRSSGAIIVVSCRCNINDRERTPDISWTTHTKSAKLGPHMWLRNEFIGDFTPHKNFTQKTTRRIPGRHRLYFALRRTHSSIVHVVDIAC